MLEKSGVGKCWRRVLEKSVGERCCREVSLRECCGEALGRLVNRSNANRINFHFASLPHLEHHGLDLFQETPQRSGVDMLLWSTNATGAEVVAASEKRFSLTATLKLQLPRAHTAVASLVMARDSWREPFSWRISAGEKSSNDEVWMGGVWGQAKWWRLAVNWVGVYHIWKDQPTLMHPLQFYHVLSVFTSGWNFPYHMDDHVFLQKKAISICEERLLGFSTWWPLGLNTSFKVGNLYRGFAMCTLQNFKVPNIPVQKVTYIFILSTAFGSWENRKTISLGCMVLETYVLTVFGVVFMQLISRNDNSKPLCKPPHGRLPWFHGNSTWPFDHFCNDLMFLQFIVDPYLCKILTNNMCRFSLIQLFLSSNKIAGPSFCISW